ncbi:hypothetical protein [Methanobacterium petrolearium]|uniref:hypothetical protein n=1 Tax=Methanobacterium petrolearium TaxID=710190 RepID=UPI0030813E02|nr:hypothetical protein GCM10025861_16560 [Methanobacterium petrolearium]
MNDSIENIWKTFNSINDWVKFSDTKATVVLATNGVILSIIFANVSKFLSLLILYPTLILILASSLLIGVFLSLISIFYSIRCLIPRTNLKIVDKKIYCIMEIYANLTAQKNILNPLTIYS